MKFLTKLFVSAAVATFVGCASTNPDPAFRDVEQTVRTRIGKRVQWNRGTPQDAEGERFVQRLLQRPLSADAAVQVALLNNHELQATYEELGIAQADVVEAGLLKNPIFSIERRFPGQALETDAFEELVDILLLPMRKRVAAAQLGAAKRRVGDEILKTAAEVRGAFYGHQGDQQLVDLRKTVAEATERSAETALRMHEAGNLKNVDLANEQASHAQAKLEFAKAQSEAAQSREKLNKLMGAFGLQTNWTIASRLPELPGKEVVASGLESRAIAQRLDLAARRQEALAFARGLGFARFQAAAQQLEVGAHYEREVEGTWSSGPSLKLPIPIFNFGQAAYARGEAKFRQSHQRYLALATQIRSDVRSTCERMLLARQRVEYFKSTALPARTRVTEESQLEYNAMQIGPFQLLQAKQEEVKMGADYVEALRDYWVSRAELERSVGGSLTGKFISLQNDGKE